MKTSINGNMYILLMLKLARQILVNHLFQQSSISKSYPKSYLEAVKVKCFISFDHCCLISKNIVSLDFGNDNKRKSNTDKPMPA